MALLHVLNDTIVSRLRRTRAAQRLHARWRRRRYERRIAAFVAVRDGRAAALPDGLVYEATMRCNLRCGFCYVGDLLNIEGQWREELPAEDLRKALPKHAGMQASLTGGEIFARKDIADVLNVFREKGYVCGYLTTNGTLIDEARAQALADLARDGFLRHVSVSIDGPDDLHDAARGLKGTFARTAAGLRRLHAAVAATRAPLRLSINTTVSTSSLPALDGMAQVARQVGVDAIGVNHLMYATAAEVDRTAELVGAADRSAIATFVTSEPGVRPGDVQQKLARLSEECGRERIRFDVRPKVRPTTVNAYYTPGTPLEGRCLYPFLQARVGFSGKVYFCPFIRVEVGDLTRSSLAEIWNGPKYVELRRRLLEERLFPVCRRCCKVELA